MKRITLFVLLLTTWLGFTVRGADGQPALTPEQVRFFETRIRPVLADRCFSCHGPVKASSGLRLDSAAALRLGSDSGKVLVPGLPEKSLLIRMVQDQGKGAKMPLKGDKLSSTQVADLTRWVKMGAPYPEVKAVASGEADKHWAFMPVGDPQVPAVKDRAWPRSPLDHFILAGLEAKGIRPAAAADRRTLIRRVTFDLTGLPPTLEEVEGFVNDARPDAYERLVDRLLASPAYGERWGRHWLDVARYADSNGLDENVAYGNAWRYRDYVIASFNRDQPYDEFVMEQVAGDLLPTSDDTQRANRLIATGFLALGPKVLAEPDERKMELDLIDEQVDTLGRAFLGLTLGCARCHDHKFDPVSTKDYYGLAGIFQSTRTMETFKKIARWHENPIGSAPEVQRKREHDMAVTRQKETIQTLAKKPAGKERDAELARLRQELTRLEKSAPVLATAMGVTEGKIGDALLLRRGNHLLPGKSVPRRFPIILAGENQLELPVKQSGRLELARWLAQKDNPLTARVMVNRVWRWHFGRGLVGSVDNFGLLGEKPTHPELLDWLACRFADSGWSVKRLHRLILLSSTYQMSSTADALGGRGSRRAGEVDPENRLYWRMNIRRLEAEAIRDSLLAVSGGLDRTMGGSLLHVPNRAFLFDHTSRDQTTYDSPLRSLYLPVIRNNLYDVFGLFDTTDGAVSSGDRATTTVATQALFLLNSDLVRKAAERLADDLGRSELDQQGRVRLLYAKAYGRPATPGEVERAQTMVAKFDDALRSREPEARKRRREAWVWLCHAVLAANEFVFVN